MYWDGSPFSELNFLSVKSFRLHHPDWKINMWMPVTRTLNRSWKTAEQKVAYTGKDHFGRLKSELDVNVLTVDFDKIGFRNSASEVIKSDYFRYWALYEHGGVWSDCDIIFIKPLESVFDFVTVDAVIGCITTRAIYYPVGFLMSKPKNDLFKALLVTCPQRYNPSEYQCLGSLLFKYLFPTMAAVKQKFPTMNVVIMDKWGYLPLEWDQLDQLFDREVELKQSSQTFGVHWFNGSAQAKQYITTSPRKPCTITNLLKAGGLLDDTVQKH
jgi:hypothetical protein